MTTLADCLDLLSELGELGEAMNDGEVTRLLETCIQTFRLVCKQASVPSRHISGVVAKFRDAGRRSPPTIVFSSVGPGRPQNAADGNRTNRWLLPGDHKFFATKRDAELVEIRFYLQTLSMSGSPLSGPQSLRTAFTWLLGHDLAPGAYVDPIMLIDIEFDEFIEDRRRVESGHYIPLARGGRHLYDNTFLMLKRSNAMQSDLTFDELLALIDDILRRQAALGVLPNAEHLPRHDLIERVPGVDTE